MFRRFVPSSRLVFVVKRAASSASTKDVKLSKFGVVELEYKDLVAGADLHASIRQAYNQDGLGILVVSGVPGFTEKRKRLLPLARRLAELPKDELAKLESPETSYSFGWSHGKEKFEGVPDVAKGSFYNNPQYNIPTEDPQLVKKFPEYCAPNIWPRKALPELESAFRDLGQLIVSVGQLVAGQCDRYVASMTPGYYPDKLRNTITSSLSCKARLLHYFPRAPEDAVKAGDASWCGWHLDHGTLTGLTPAMFVDENLNEVDSPDPEAGLYVRARSGKVLKVGVERSHIAFQMGQTSQVHTGGALIATPHMVKAPTTGTNISRETLAVFMQPSWDAPMDIPAGTDPKQVGVPEWRAGTDFSEFTKTVMANYY